MFCPVLDWLVLLELIPLPVPFVEDLELGNIPPLTSFPSSRVGGRRLGYSAGAWLVPRGQCSCWSGLLHWYNSFGSIMEQLVLSGAEFGSVLDMSPSSSNGGLI